MSEKVRVVKAVRMSYTRATGRSHVLHKWSNGTVDIHTFILNPLTARPGKITVRLWETSLLRIAQVYEEALFDKDNVIFPKEDFEHLRSITYGKV